MTDIKSQCFQFSIRVVLLVEQLPKSSAGYTVGNQVIRSGTAIGAILEEASGGLSYNDFVKLLRESRKEAKETLYWLRLIHALKLSPSEIIEPLIKECDEIVRIISKSIMTSESRQPAHRIRRRKS